MKRRPGGQRKRSVTVYYQYRPDNFTLWQEHLFDLQAQFDKISRFEDRLRQGRSSVLYPNFMAAKWREVYDKEKRKQQEQEWNVGREEGEVT